MVQLTQVCGSGVGVVDFRGSIPGLNDTISEIGYLLLPSSDVAKKIAKAT